MTRIPILDCAPTGITLREQQVESLLYLEANYDKYKAFCIVAPVGAGKSIIAVTFANWIVRNIYGSCALITPTKMQQDQYQRDFPYLTMLKGQSEYTCHATYGAGSCKNHKEERGTLCNGPEDNHKGKACAWFKACEAAKQADIAICNFHSLYFNKIAPTKSNLLVDEAHNVKPFIESLLSFDLFGCAYNFDKTHPIDKDGVLKIVGNALSVASSERSHALAHKASEDLVSELDDLIKRLEFLAFALGTFGGDILITPKEETWTKSKFYSKDMSAFKGKPQYMLRIKPLRVDRMVHSLLWKDCEKIFLTSATINEVDLGEIGLKKEDVAFLSTSSPIQPDQRKVIVMPVGKMGSRNRAQSMPHIIHAIQTIASKNHDKKGLVHCTYEIARELQKHLKSPRFMFHNQYDKDRVYRMFRESKDPKVLVACGMAEGIDLPDDYARWQVIAKVQFQSLGDEVWKWIKENRPDIYNWDAAKTIIQQSGRICRGPQDYGTTYIIDSDFLYLWKNAKHMFPSWFSEALVWLKSKKS